MIVKLIVNSKVVYNKESEDVEAIRTYDNFIKVYRESLDNNTIANIQLIKGKNIIVQETFEKRL